MKYFGKVIKLSFLLLLVLQAGCTSTQPATSSFTENNGANVSSDQGQTLTITPQPTVRPQPTATLEKVKVEIPVQKIVFDFRAVKNEDGTFSYPFFEGDDGVYNQPEMPTYIWHINPYSHQKISNISLSFDVFETETIRAYGLDRGVLVNLYNLNPIPDSKNPDKEIFCQVCILRNPPMGEWMDRYDKVQTDAQGVQHHQINIPYDQFLGGKTELAVQFLPGVTYSEPVMMIEGVNLNPETLISEITSTITPSSLDHHWMDVYVTGDIPTSFPAGTPDFSSTERLNMSGGVLFLDEAVTTTMLPAATFNIQDQVGGDFVLVPESAAVIEMFPRLANSTLEFMRNNMLDPETGLISGVWDFSANDDSGVLVLPGRITSNILLVSDLRYGYQKFTYNPENAQFLEALIKRAVDQEIVFAPNGQLLFAPGGINNGEMVIELKNLSIYLTEIYRELRTIDLERADMLLEGYANTLQLVVEAQEQTPSNLVSSTIKVKFHEDTSYSFEYLDDFDMGNSFYFFWLNNYAKYKLSEEITCTDIFDPGLIEYFTHMSKEVQVHKANEMKVDGERFDNVNRIPSYIFRILYNIYVGSDGNYAQYYTLENGNPVEKQVTSSTDEWAEFRQRYGSFTSLTNWLSLAGFYNDDVMLFEVYPIIPKGRAILNNSVFEPMFSNQEDQVIDRDHVVRLSAEGFNIYQDIISMSGAWNGDDTGLTSYDSAAYIPWGMNGVLGWRVNFDEYIALVEDQYGLPFSEIP